MQIQALHTVHNSGWTPAYERWNEHQMEHTGGFTACARWIETAPVMPSTVLGLELLLQDRSLDLQMASELILRDVGATLQVMRLMSKEVKPQGERPFRMTQCLATVDASVWFPILAANALSANQTSAEIAGMWKHCRCVAHFAKLIAESLGEVAAEDAYLAGLLHEVENIGELVSKRSTASTTEAVQLHHVLASSVVTALQSAKRRDNGSVWRYVLASAHALATTRTPPSVIRPAVAAKPFVV